MKFYYIPGVIAFLAVVACVRADNKEELDALSNACIQEIKTTKEDLDNFYKNGMKESDATEGVQCHVKCMMEKQGYFKNSQFDEQSFIKTLQAIPALKDRQADIIKEASECKEEKGANDCETAFKIAMCFMDKKE